MQLFRGEFNLARSNCFLCTEFSQTNLCIFPSAEDIPFFSYTRTVILKQLERKHALSTFSGIPNWNRVFLLRNFFPILQSYRYKAKIHWKYLFFQDIIVCYSISFYQVIMVNAASLTPHQPLWTNLQKHLKNFDSIDKFIALKTCLYFVVFFSRALRDMFNYYVLCAIVNCKSY